MSDVTTRSSFPRPARRARTLVLLGLGAIVAVPLAAFAGGGLHAGACSRAWDASPAELQEHVDDGAERLLDRVDATDAQRGEVAAALDGAGERMAATHGSGRALHERAHDALTAETIDAGAVEAVRVEGLALLDAASRDVSATMIEIAGVLTRDQRQELAESWTRGH